MVFPDTDPSANMDNVMADTSQQELKETNKIYTDFQENSAMEILTLPVEANLNSGNMTYTLAVVDNTSEHMVQATPEPGTFISSTGQLYTIQPYKRNHPNDENDYQTPKKTATQRTQPTFTITTSNQYESLTETTLNAPESHSKISDQPTTAATKKTNINQPGPSGVKAKPSHSTTTTGKPSPIVLVTKVPTKELHTTLGNFIQNIEFQYTR